MLATDQEAFGRVGSGGWVEFIARAELKVWKLRRGVLTPGFGLECGNGPGEFGGFCFLIEVL